VADEHDVGEGFAFVHRCRLDDEVEVFQYGNPFVQRPAVEAWQAVAAAEGDDVVKPVAQLEGSPAEASPTRVRNRPPGGSASRMRRRTSFCNAYSK
jgi:hypothetical protein